MRSFALRARPRRRRLPVDMGIRPTTHLPANALDRDFRADRPNAKWVADFTYVWSAEGWLYVAVVLDLFSRRVVGWPMRADMTSELVTDALMMAIWRRGRPRSVLHHSDRGSQYGSEAFQRLRAQGLPDARRREGRRVRLYRALLQPAPPSLDDRLRESDGVRGQDTISLTACLPNAGQASLPYSIMVCAICSLSFRGCLGYASGLSVTS